MNTNRFLLASLAAGAWIFVYGFVVNAVILGDFWSSQPAADLMRARGDEVMWAIVASCILQGLALGFIFTRGYQNRGVVEGIRFGLLVAWFVAAIYLLFYALQPYTLTGLAVSSATDGLMYVGAGIMLALIYRN